MTIWTVLLYYGGRHSRRYEAVQVYARNAAEAGAVALGCAREAKVRVVSARQDPDQ